MLDVIEDSAAAQARRVDRALALLERTRPAHQRAALEAWIARARTGRVARRDLSAAMFGRGLRWVTLVEVLEGGADYRVQIEGREVVRRFGRGEGMAFSRLYAADHLSRLRAFYETVTMAGYPNLRRFVAVSLAGEEMAFSQLVLPATDPEGRVARLAAVFDVPDGAVIPTAPLRLHAPWRRLERGTGRETIPGDWW